VKYVDEYRDRRAADRYARAIARITTREWNIMEVCGGQTHAIVKFGIDELLPKRITLLHGPGCPVCVTPVELIDKATQIAERPEVIFCSFGDMLRVPGTTCDLFDVKSRGGDVRIVYSPLDAVRLARENPGRKVVFFAIGFETTAPANAMAAFIARREKLANFSMLVSHVLVPPAIAAILQTRGNRVQAFLGPGHVCAVMGVREYEALSARYRVPIVVSGFEPVDLLEGVLRAVQQLERGEAKVENPYARVVAHEGNKAARELMYEVFEVSDRKWRGVGSIPKSGFKLRHEYRDHDASKIFEVEAISTEECAECISGLVLRGLKKPSDCAAFGKRCTPQSPMGATMVSAEGACAAYYQYGRYLDAHGALAAEGK
jgi:hydrogenase expression/formation protein HypD